MLRTNRPPSYRHFKPKDLAVVRIDGKDHYLGNYNSPASWRKYHELLLKHCSQAEHEDKASTETAPEPISIKELCLAYFEFAEQYYRKNGKVTPEVDCIRHSLRRLLKLFGDTLVTEFGPKALKQVRDEFIREELARVTINNNVGRIKRMFRWAVENELIPVTVYQALAAVAGLRKGRGPARESVPVQPVDDAAVESALPFMARQVQAMVKLQRLTGCRPGEISALRPCDLDQSGEVWCFRPESHKTAHHGNERRIFLGPQAQEILRPWLNRDPQQYCFSPKEAEAERRAGMHARRKTPLHYGNRPGTNRKPRPSRPAGEKYMPQSYRQAIARACQQAKIESWSPNQLRHARATELRRLYGLDAAQVVLGHTEAFVTQIYAERDFGRAEEIMRMHG